MNRFTRVVGLLFLSLLSLVALPIGAFAAQVATETVTIQVNITTPDGTTFIGTVVAHRQDTTPVTTELTFNGTVNGVPTKATATATEEWSSDGQAHIVITNLQKVGSAPLTGLSSLSKGAAVLAAPLARDVDVILMQPSPNLISVNGIPLAIDGQMTKPFTIGGRAAYVVTMPGQGSTQIAVLPRTGNSGLILTPLLLGSLLVGFGLVLVGVSRRVRAGATRAAVKH